MSGENFVHMSGVLAKLCMFEFKTAFFELTGLYDAMCNIKK